MKKDKSSLLLCSLLLIGIMLVAPPKVIAAVGSSDNGILAQEWSYDMHYYTWGWFGSSPAIADLGCDINNEGTELDSDLEIATGSDELWGPAGSAGVWRVFDSNGNLEWQTGTQTDEARSSLCIIDIDGNGDLEMAGGTTSGWYLQVLDHLGNFVWTFPKITVPYIGGPFVWPSSPAVTDLDESISGLEVVIGNRNHGNVWCFDGDNSDGLDEGITITAADFSGFPYTLGVEGTDWDVLWKFDTGGPVVASPAIGDVDNDGNLEVVIGSTDGNIYVLDGATGSLEHTFSTGSAVYASAAISNLDSDVYLEMVVGSTDGNIYGFEWDGTTASTEWTYPTGAPVYSSAAIGDLDGDGALEVVVGSNDTNVYSLNASGGLNWSYSTGNAVYSSPALADRACVYKYDRDWPMFRHNPRRTGFYGPGPSTGLDVYVGSEDRYLYLLDGSTGAMIDRFETNFGGYSGYQGIHTSPSVADADGDHKLEIFFYDWGSGSAHNGHTFWALEDAESHPCFNCPLTQGFWKNHPDDWPSVCSLVLGDETYTKAELLEILKTPTKGDASMILAHQLIAAKLNIANGSDHAPVVDIIADADDLLSQFDGKLPFGVKPSSSIGQAMVSDAEILTDYNEGLLTPDC